jgi:hypothetical protein
LGRFASAIALLLIAIAILRVAHLLLPIGILLVVLLLAGFLRLLLLLLFLGIALRLTRILRILISHLKPPVHAETSELTQGKQAAPRNGSPRKLRNWIR